LLRTVIVVAIVLSARSVFSQERQARKSSKKSENMLSFKKDVYPIIQKNCLPCHSEDNFNPSELAMDDYEMMKAGGKNGPIWVTGKPGESILVKKLSEKPPFGDRMPLNSKKKIAEGRGKWLTEEEVKAIVKWIDGGAKNN
jgi:hypothetical protein